MRKSRARNMMPKWLARIEREQPLPGLFTARASASLSRVFDTFVARGGEYGDTWRDCQHLTLRAVYRELTGKELDLKICRALAAAVMVDMKYQRSEGGWKDDTVIDGIAYAAFLAEEMRKLAKGDKKLDRMNKIYKIKRIRQR